MQPTTLIYSSHNCSPYIHRQFIVEPALQDPHDKRLLYLPMSEAVKSNGDEFEGQKWGWDKFAWYLNQFRQYGLEPQPFYWSKNLRREDVDVLLEILAHAPVVILGGGNTYLGMRRYEALGERFYGDRYLFCRMMHERQARGQLTVGFSAGADQLSSLFSGVVYDDYEDSQGFGLARDVVVTLHHEWSRRDELRKGAAAVGHCAWFGLPNDSGLAINTGKLPSGLIWQFIRFVIDKSWDIPQDQFHIKTRQGLGIDHYYSDGRHWSFNEGETMLRLMSEDGSFRRSWIATGGRILDYNTQDDSGYGDINQILAQHS